MNYPRLGENALTIKMRLFNQLEHIGACLPPNNIRWFNWNYKTN